VPIVIVVIPIAIGMPPVAVFVPPAMPLVPTAFSRFVQFVARVIRLPAVPTVMLDGLVQLMIPLGDAALATIVILGGRLGRSSECQHPQNRRRYEQGPSQKLLLSQVKRHISSILQISPRLGWGEVLLH